MRCLKPLGALLVVPALVVGCDRGVQDPVEEFAPGPVSFAVGDNVSASVQGEEFRVCKFGSSGTFQITEVTSLGVPLINGTGIFTLQDGECVTAALHESQGGFTAELQVEEISTESGFVLDHIEKTQSICGLDQGTECPASGGPIVTTDNDATDPVSGFVGGSGTAANRPEKGLSGVLVEYFNVPEVTGGGEGCTPGYWKQDQHFDSYPVGVTPSTTLASVGFDVSGLALAHPESGTATDITFLEALSLRGGGVNALLRHAAAAYLNSLTVSFDLSASEVVADFNAAVSAGGTAIGTQKDAFEDLNEQGCPLN